MRRALGVTVSVLLLAVARAGGAQAPPVRADPSAGAGAVSGVVTDAATGRPVAGALVRLIAFDSTAGNEPQRRAPLVTDARGRFVFLNLSPTWRFTLWASHPGYGVVDYRDQRGPRSEVRGGRDDYMPLRVDAGEWLRNANLQLWRLGAIGGRVVDEHGEPVVGAAVRLFSRRFVAGHQTVVPGAVVSTDDRGIYRFAGVGEDDFFVAVLSVQATVPVSAADGPRDLPLGGLEGRGSRPPTEAGVPHGASIDGDGRHRLILTNFATPPPPTGDGLRVYPPLVYPAARSIDDALPITMVAGTSRLDIDFQLSPVRAARVSGRVSGAIEATEHMLLRLMTPGTEHLGFGAEVATTLVEADGSFTFLNVPAGDYTLLASPDVAEPSGGGGFSDGRLPKTAGYGTARGLSAVYGMGVPNVMWWRSEAGAGSWGRMSLSVGAGGVTGLDLPLRRSVSVRGRLVFDDPELPEQSRFPILFEPATGDAWLGVPNVFTAAGDDTYSFEVEGLKDGRYLTRLPSFYGRTWRIRSVVSRGIDLTEAGFDGTLGTDYDDVVVTLSRVGAELSGVVRDGDNRPVGGTVLLFPVEPDRWRDYGLSPDRLATAPATATGAYTFSRMPDGQYYVVAVPALDSNALLNPEFLAAAAGRATRVTLAAGRPASQALIVIDGGVR